MIKASKKLARPPPTNPPPPSRTCICANTETFTPLSRIHNNAVSGRMLRLRYVPHVRHTYTTSDVSALASPSSFVAMCLLAIVSPSVLRVVRRSQAKREETYLIKGASRAEYPLQLNETSMALFKHCKTSHTVILTRFFTNNVLLCSAKWAMLTHDNEPFGVVSVSCRHS